jgi:hypothetical protein
MIRPCSRNGLKRKAIVGIKNIDISTLKVIIRLDVE